MKVDLVWPKCIDFDLDYNSGPEDVFWVEFEYNEARSIVLSWLKRYYPRKIKKIAAEIEENHRMLNRSHVNSYTKNLWKKGYVYFLISRELNLIKPMPHYFPYSGLWNTDNPFIKIYPQLIYDLEDIKIIDSTPVKIKELPTWAERSKFGYIGSVEQGVIIHYGNGRQIRIRPSQFAQMVGHFAGRAVKVAASQIDRSMYSLESWLKQNVTKSAIVSYVAPILIAEGLAEKDNDPTMLRFTDKFILDLDYDILNEYIEPMFSAYNFDTGKECTFDGINEKVLWRLEEQGKVLYRRVKRSGADAESRAVQRN